MGANFDCVTGHVNNVVYNRYAESARVNWTLNFANFFDPAHKAQWRELMTPKNVGLILRSIRTDYKFVRTLPRLPG
jgi:acyl-CoA thioesterase FadM